MIRQLSVSLQALRIVILEICRGDIRHLQTSTVLLCDRQQSITRMNKKYVSSHAEVCPSWQSMQNTSTCIGKCSTIIVHIIRTDHITLHLATLPLRISSKIKGRSVEAEQSIRRRQFTLVKKHVVFRALTF